MVRKKLEFAESFKHLGAMFSPILTVQATSESNKKREAFAHYRRQKDSLTPIIKVPVYKSGNS